MKILIIVKESEQVWRICGKSNSFKSFLSIQINLLIPVTSYNNYPEKENKPKSKYKKNDWKLNRRRQVFILLFIFITIFD